MNIFLSHVPSDGPQARRLAAELSAGGFEVWLATEEDVEPGGNWYLEIGAALARADAMVVLLSPQAVSAATVRREIEHALTNRRFEGRLIPVVARSTERIPWILKHLPLIDLDEGVVAAAARIRDLLTRPQEPFVLRAREAG